MPAKNDLATVTSIAPATHEHKGFEPDNCPLCGTAAVIPNAALETAAQARGKLVAGRKAKVRSESAEKPADQAELTECTNGHPRAEFWTVTAGGRSYCRLCAREASAKSRAKNGRPSARKVALSTEALDAIEKVANFKTTATSVRDELTAFVAAHRPAPTEAWD